MEDLQEFRRIASEHSEGNSAPHIHQLFIDSLSSLNAKGRILDFGAGQGTLTIALDKTNQFDQVSAADLYPRPDNINDSIEWFEKDLNAEISGLDSQFDFVVAAEVIEHLENPRLIFRQWMKLLKPGGYLLCSTPNNESYRSILSLILRGHFIAFTDAEYPAHITALVAKDLERISLEAKFQNIQFKYTNFGAVPKMTSLTWQKISMGLCKGKRFSDNIMLICQKPL